MARPLPDQGWGQFRNWMGIELNSWLKSRNWTRNWNWKKRNWNWIGIDKKCQELIKELTFFIHVYFLSAIKRMSDHHFCHCSRILPYLYCLIDMCIIIIIINLYWKVYLSYVKILEPAFNLGPSSEMTDQHYINIGSMFEVSGEDASWKISSR